MLYECMLWIQIMCSGGHSIYFERGVIFLKSDQLFCLDDFMVTVPNGFATVFYSP